uniref:Protein iscw iscw004447 ovary overexpressed n=1 Tax=Rhipicephalus microplus TaxID=6941 RepID=A0A6M2D2Q1_RHIMP
MAVAERALGFRHLSANPDKLLVTATDAASLEYHLPDRSPLTIDSAGLRVHVAGCLSFALGPEAKEEGVNSPSSPSRAKSALGNAPSQGSRSSEALRFKGNVTWLGAVVGSVMRKLRSELPESRARAERGLVEELSMLQRRLQQCDSVGEFFDTLSI